MKSIHKFETHKPGRIYFTKKTERRVFFFLTLAMLGAGLLVRLV